MSFFVNISGLAERYNITRQAVNDRINNLKIIRPARGRVTNDDLILLDELDKHIKSGGTIDNFVKSPEVVETYKASEELSRNATPGSIPVDTFAIIQNNESSIDVINKMASMLEKLIFSKSENPLSRFENLDKAAFMEIALPTSVIKQLTGVTPKGIQLIYGSYSIRRCHKKIGREAGWLIIKEEIKLFSLIGDSGYS